MLNMRSNGTYLSNYEGGENVYIARYLKRLTEETTKTTKKAYKRHIKD